MARFTFLANVLISISGSALATQLTTNEQSRLRSFSNGSDTEASSTILMKDAPSVQSLMVCNAYAHTKALDIFDLTSHSQLTADRPLSYKDCSNYRLPLHEGEELEFRTGNLSVGVFRATGLPRGPSSLLLIPHRRSPSALNAAFQSHAFADMGSSQLVVIDVYKGTEAGKIKIRDNAQPPAAGKQQDKPAMPQRSEELKFNSVVQVNPGNYDILLEDSTDKSLSSVSLHVPTEKAKYVVLRLGNQQTLKATEPAAFPQELVVRQQSDSSAQAARLPLLALSAALLAGLLSRP